MPDGDGVEVLVLASGLYKNLIIEVVQIMRDEHVNVSHDLQYI